MSTMNSKVLYVSGEILPSTVETFDVVDWFLRC